MTVSSHKKLWVAIAAAYALILQTFFCVLADARAFSPVADDGFAICLHTGSTAHPDEPVPPSSDHTHHACCVLCAAAPAPGPARLGLPAAFPVSIKRELTAAVRLSIAAETLPKMSQGPPRFA
jgi:hypothetical protein